MKPGSLLKSGNTWVDSRDAKENIRFRILDMEDMFGELMKVMYSGGNGGRGGTSCSLDPCLPQQKSALLPMSRIYLQCWHSCVLPALLSFHHNDGVDIGPICHIQVAVHAFWSIIGGWWIVSQVLDSIGCHSDQRSITIRYLLWVIVTSGCLRLHQYTTTNTDSKIKVLTMHCKSQRL